jgi:hypothetical protein
MAEQYQRNNAIVGFIVGVIVVGAILVGTFAYLGQTTYSWINISSEKVDYDFEQPLIDNAQIVTLDLDLDVGTVLVEFEDNPSLLYRMDLETTEDVVERDGDPTVTYTTQTIALDYSVAAINVTLGSGTVYFMDVQTATGSINLQLTNNAQIGNINIQTNTGAIWLMMTDEVIIPQSMIVDLDTTTGAIEAIIELPNEVGGVFTATTNIGSVDINTSMWQSIGTAHYETPNYRSADTLVTIQADTNVGSIDAILI